ncbi:MAG: hypothetical protein AB1540_07070 [Bdellovibrionota bacterium]
MRVLLLSANEKDQEFFQAASRLANYPFLSLGSAEEICAEVQREPASIVVVDVSNKDTYTKFEKCVADKLGLFSAQVNPNLLFYVSDEPFHEMSYLSQSQIFGHFVHRSFEKSDLALISRLFLLASAEKAFGLERFFVTEAKMQSVVLTKSLQKKVIIESLKGHLTKLGFKSRVATVIATATDELIMNAIFDAPVNDLGKHTHSQTPRNAAFELLEKNAVEMKVGFDGNTLGISVIDHHGSLDKRKLLTQHLGKTYESRQYEAKSITAGAGLGLTHVYRNCGGIVFVCEAGGRTEVNIFYKKTASFKDFKDQFRFLSTFMYFS